MSKITFIEEGHYYLNSKGVIIPSVSELIRFKFPNQYEGVPERILKNKASYGTKLHSLVEDLFLGKTTLEEINSKKIDPNLKVSCAQAEELRKKWCIFIQDSEQIISYQDRYAGTYDLRDMQDEIIDIKTTTEIHEDWIQLQLSLYYLALGIKKEMGYCLHLPKGKPGRIVAIKTLSHDYCKGVLEEYEKEQINSN